MPRNEPESDEESSADTVMMYVLSNGYIIVGTPRPGPRGHEWINLDGATALDEMGRDMNMDLSDVRIAEHQIAWSAKVPYDDVESYIESLDSHEES